MSDAAARPDAEDASAWTGLRWWVVPVALALLAAALRLVALPTRGRFDADQGDHLLVVLAMVRDGVVPLLGPTTFLPGVYHGALYYWLLAPLAAVSDTDPTVVTLTFVGAGLVAVLATWWLARSIAGDLAGATAGLLMAVSATEVFASVTIWNPHFVPAASAVALAGAWRAWGGRHPSGWLVAALGLSVAVQVHVLAVVLAPTIVGLYLLDLRRGWRSGRRGLLLAGLGAALILAAGFVPLLVHETQTGFAELRQLLDYLASGAGGAAAGQGLAARILIVAWRVVSWPLVGLFVDALVGSTLAVVGIVAIVVWRSRSGTSAERSAVIFLGLTVVVGTILLAALVPSLDTVIRELPVDHYHAALDPAIVTLVAIGLAAALRRLGRSGGSEDGRTAIAIPPGIAGATAVLGIAALVGLVGWNLATQPAAVAPDGGWPAASAAGDRIIAASAGGPIGFLSLPSFKTAGAYAFAVERARAPVVEPTDLADGDLLVVLCDDTFREAIGADCGGPAETAAVAEAGLTGAAVAVDRFDPAPGRHLSLYRLVGGQPSSP